MELPDLNGLIPEIRKSTIFIHPIPDEELKSFGTIIERKGNEATRKELERIRDFFENLGWRHLAGGRYSDKHADVLNKESETKAGDEQSEYHIPGPGKAFELDGRPGGHFTDLTFEMPDGQKIHVQSVDVDRNGKPTKRELDAAERIRRAERDTHILLIPKGAQLKKKRPFKY